MTIALITLTYPAEWRFAEYFSPKMKAYKGRVLLDASRIESIEEIIVDGEAPLSYVTLRSNCAHTVTETPDQIMELMGRALNHTAKASNPTSGRSHLPSPVRPADPQFYDRLAEMHGR